VALLETAATGEQNGCADGEVRESIGAVEETVLERMRLICLALRTGYLLLAKGAADRPYATWQAWVEERLTALRLGVRYLVSDRAKALLQLAAKGLECLSMPAGFHGTPDLVKSYALPIIRRVSQAQQELQKAEDGLSKPPGLDGPWQGPLQASPRGAGLRAAVHRWEAVHRPYRHPLAALSLTLPPLHIHDSPPQPSAQVHSRLPAASAAIEA
jgi:hypothetical protein